MRATTFTLIAAATLAAAQTGAVPDCAKSCVLQALPASCKFNPECICSDTAFISTISCCVLTACDTSGQQAALAYAKQVCAPVGVTNLPTAASCAATAASSGTSAASAATATGSSASSALSSASQILSSLASSASQISSSLSSSASSAASSASSAASSASRSASSAASSASSAASAQSTGAAPTLSPMGIAGVAALGAFALL
ncbi:hypothetical protein M436DRAFT_71311 [Aureobasidium namibiae CBS 147.97]|uniref:CFEM domain-containing protein n=1 Tax=Aureobasidium namibiae CBS 147.97 TaxID=1043004 RepID=A0A074XJT5_9PEZI